MPLRDETDVELHSLATWAEERACHARNRERERKQRAAFEEERGDPAYAENLRGVAAHDATHAHAYMLMAKEVRARIERRAREAARRETLRDLR